MPQEERLRELSSRLDAWLRDPLDTEPALARELVGLSSGELRGFTELYSSRQRAEITEALLNKVALLQARSPKAAPPLCTLAIQFARFYRAKTPEEFNRSMLLQADAWREYGWTLMLLGDYEEAKTAIAEAALYYSVVVIDDVPPEDSDDLAFLHGTVLAHHLHSILSHYRDRKPRAPLSAVKRTAIEGACRAGVMLGETLHNLGKTDEGLSIIERSSEVLLYFLDSRDRYVRARTVYAKILGEAQRWAEALSVFQATSALASESDDQEVQAFIVSNYGVCYYYLGFPEKARKYAELGVQMFEELGKPNDAIRPRTLLVLLLMDEGKERPVKYHAAIAELFKIRAAWLAAGMKNEAAQTMVRIIRAFVLSKRIHSINWAEMNRTFVAANLGSAALSVLQKLEKIAAQRPLTTTDADEALAALSHLAPTGELIEEAG